MLIFGDFDRVGLRSRRGWVMGVGVCLALLGGIAVSMPLVASLAIESVIGWLMVVAGSVMAISGYRERRHGRGGFGDLLGSALTLITGIILLVKPMSGVITLTMILSLYFAAEGIFKVIVAVKLRGLDGWLWLLFSGLLALLLAGLIWHNLFAAAWGVGLLVGINLLFTGSTLVALGITLGREE
ncbi:MAG: HdeD family acid-resistance protein [Synergistales bacterium]|nr:HdeD family acid-resistance protein [Synergistales bacterium]